MDDNVMRRYLTVAKEPRELIQFDQGEDRWLCTLLIQQGYRIEYCAGSDALTFAPEALSEYFTQQRRWITSTMANVLDLISSYQTTIEKNRDISYGFMIYQFVLFAASLLAPATIVLLIGGSYNAILGTGLLESYALGLSSAVFYCLICVTCKSNTQIYVGIVLSAVYGIIMMLVLVALVVNSRIESIASPNVSFLIAITVLFLVSGLLHPREFFCLAPGLLYIFAIPFSLLFLIIYSLCNMHVVSWGTREVKREKTPEELEEERLEEERRKEKAKNSGVLNMLGLAKTVADLKIFSMTMLNRALPEKQDKTELEERLQKMENLLEVIVEDKAPKKNELREMLQKSKSGEKKDEKPKPVPSKKPEAPKSKPLPEPPKDLGTKEELIWINDDILAKRKLGKIDPREEDFWKAMLKYYLHPLDSNKQEEKETANALKELRNSVVLGLAMLNIMWVILIFLFQVLKDSLGEELFIPIPQGEGKIEFFEPVGLIFLGFFAMLLIVQFTATLVHRVGTILHLIAITNIKWPWSKHIGDQEKELEDAIKLITKLQSIEKPEFEFLEPATDYDDESTVREAQEDQMTEYSRLDRMDQEDDLLSNPYPSEPEYLDQFGIPMSYDQTYRQTHRRRRRSRHPHKMVGVRDISGGTLSHAFDRRFTKLNKHRAQEMEEYEEGHDRRYERGHSRDDQRRNYREMLEAFDRQNQDDWAHGYDENWGF